MHFIEEFLYSITEKVYTANKATFYLDKLKICKMYKHMVN